MKRQAAVVCLLALAATALYLCYLIAKPFLTPLIIAVMIAIVFHPLHLKVQTLVRKSNGAAALSTTLVLLVVAIPLVLLGISVSRELGDAIQMLREQRGSQVSLSPYLGHLLEKLSAWLQNYVNLSQLDPQAALLRGVEQLSRSLLAAGAAVLSNMASFSLGLVVIFFSLFFFFRDGEVILRGFAAIFPLNPDQSRKLFVGIGETMTANLYGGLAVAVAQGTLTGLAFAVLGLSAPILWALFTALASLIPVVGSALVWGPAAILLFLTGHWIKATILLAWGAGIVGQIDAVVRPYVIGTHVKVHTLLVFFSLLGGVEAFGVAGIFIGPIVLSFTMAILDMLKTTDFSWKSAP